GPAVECDEVSGADQAAEPLAGAQGLTAARAVVAVADVARKPALLRLRERRGVEVVVSLGVAAQVEHPRDPRARDGEVEDAGAAPVVVGLRRVRAAASGRPAAGDVPAQHLVFRAPGGGAYVVGDAISVERGGLDPALTLPDLDGGSASSRRTC